MARQAEGLRGIVPEDYAVERIASGFIFTEGPIWMPDGTLFFSDIPADRLCQWNPDHGSRVVRTPNGRGNGMTLDNDGNLLVCEHATSTVTRGVGGGDREVVASHVGGRELNSPNDIVVASDGTIYFTDPDFGRTLTFVGVIREVQQCVRGVYRIRPGGGEPELLVTDMGQPNGLCLSPDARTLYVGDTPRAHIRSFDLLQPAPFTEQTVFAEDVSETEERDDNWIDGMKVDERGNLYVTGPGGIWVYDPAGNRLGVIDIPEQAANLNWGEADWQTLFVTATTSVYRVRLDVAGNRLGYMG